MKEHAPRPFKGLSLFASLKIGFPVRTAEDGPVGRVGQSENWPRTASNPTPADYPRVKSQEDRSTTRRKTVWTILRYA